MPAYGAIAARGARRRRERRESVGGCAPTPVSAAERKRQDQARKESQREVRLNRIVKKYDTNNSKKLEKGQLMKLLTDIDSSTPKGTPPTEDEVSFVLKSADKSGDGAIASDELEDAMCAWMTYIEMRDEWDKLLEKYDVSKTGTLSRDEVSAYLKELNGGCPVSGQELDMVLKEADVTGTGEITKMELSKATAVWYGYVERKTSQFCAIS